MANLQMHNIEQLTRNYKDAHDVLSDRLLDLQAEIDTIKRARIRGIKSAIAKVADTKNALQTAVADSPALFVSPRTTVFYGVKVGLQKAKGKLKFNAKKLVERARKLLSKTEFNRVIKTEYKPVKAALELLPAEDLKRLGVEITGAGDQVVIKIAGTDIDKMIESLLGDFDNDEEVAA